MRRARLHAALADPGRLRIVDALGLGDASPSDLQHELGMTSNLLAHHLRTLENAGLVTRHRSEADRRRTYLQLVPDGLDGLLPDAALGRCRAARGVRLHREHRPLPARGRPVGDEPAPSRSRPPAPTPPTPIAPGAVAAARRHGLKLTQVTAPSARRRPPARRLRDHRLRQRPRRARPDRTEGADGSRLHWSVPDPVRGRHRRRVRRAPTTTSPDASPSSRRGSPPREPAPTPPAPKERRTR